MTEANPIGTLAAALSKAQGMIKGAAKDSENPHFKSRYADLASVWEACREALTKNDLAIAQPISGGPDTINITTILLHKSGESIESMFTIRPTKPDAQGIGSAITYGRRYGLAAMVGVAPDDDDGNAASAPSTAPAKAPIVTKEQATAAIAAKKNLVTYSLNNLDGAIPPTFAAPASFLTALGKGLKEADDPIAYWEANYDVFQGIEQAGKAQLDDGLVERCKKAQAYANERAATLNSDLKGAGMP